MFTINLTEEELQFIVNVVAELPFKDVEGLIGKIRSQVDEQVRQGNEE